MFLGYFAGCEAGGDLANYGVVFGVVGGDERDNG